MVMQRIANPRTSVRLLYPPQNPLIQCNVDIILINNAITEGIGNNVGSTTLEALYNSSV